MSFDQVFEQAQRKPRIGYLYTQLVNILNNNDSNYRNLLIDFITPFGHHVGYANFTPFFSNLQSNNMEALLSSIIPLVKECEWNDNLNQLLELVIEKFN
jgi:hypothetical protein